MNQERPDEAIAKQIVEGVLGVSLEHADTTGGVDYLSSDSRVALEVTRVTDGRKIGAWKAFRHSRDASASSPRLDSCWIVFVSDTQPGMKTIHQRVEPMLAALEAAGVDHYFAQRDLVRALEGHELGETFRELAAAGVERGSAVTHDADASHVHRALVSMGSGGSASGSDEALERLIGELEGKPDNALKLRESGAENRHLFVWIDDDTPFDISRPLSRDAPSWDDGHFGVPSRRPELDPAITHLWVVHERSRRGWLWNGDTWRALRDL
jgi:hypothetical protein